MSITLFVCELMTMLGTLCVIISLYTFEPALNWCRLGAILVAVASVALVIECLGSW